MKTIFILHTVFFLANAFPTSQRNNQTACQKLLTDSGASDTFDARVGHDIHSLTVDDLKKFDLLATENNFIPTIDQDLRSEHAILSYAPDLKSKDSDAYLTEPMKVLDSVLTHMNEKHWDIVGFSPLERIVHAFHMRETWARVKKEFDQIGKTTKAPDDDVCACAMDIENNGIMKVLRFTAMALREPDLVFGDRKSEVWQQTYKDRALRDGQIKTDVSMTELLVRNKNDSGTVKALVDAEAWALWKDIPDKMDSNFDTALFLYCAIQKAHKVK